ncbi:uncharacterized protein LOC121513475 [Cheilinus undulatus]|uniref:uncharacterized protein LOC121513475 n=1 Tax=Cheilinus undulatus TaxID=241271 RepID=UPI001BD4DBB4|nr:uncharacterized protein LOC121513475 [Cheilinus undulatus]
MPVLILHWLKTSQERQGLPFYQVLAIFGSREKLSADSSCTTLLFRVREINTSSALYTNRKDKLKLQFQDYESQSEKHSPKQRQIAEVMKTLFHITLVLLVAVTSAIRITSSSLETISSYRQLEYLGFDEPPRYGLKLLNWFIQNCLDNNMVATCKPDQGDYGFHPFYNNERLFPKIWDSSQYTYYSIGNLNSPGANRLPYDIRRYLTQRDLRSNMDRVVVRYNHNNRRIEEIYITAHYSRQETYRIDPELVQSVRSGSNNQDSWIFPACNRREDL